MVAPKISRVVLLLVAVFAGGCNAQNSTLPSVSTPAPAAQTSTAALPNFAALVKKEGPAVVNISSVQKIRGGGSFPGFPGLAPEDPFFEFFRRFGFGDQAPQEFSTQSLGSGFIVSADGYILTNAHVVANASEVTVRLVDKREFKAKVIGADERTDVALIKIDAKGLPTVAIGDPAKLEVGEWVVAIGSPFGFTNSVTQGIVSAKGRDLPGGSIVPFIQTDVPVNPGNSGGPLFNLSGEVVGINSQIYSNSGGYMGLSFAIPIDIAMKVKDQLQSDGKVRRGRLGVGVQDVTPGLAESFGSAKAAGALVTSVEQGSPAEKAGIRIGDIIVKFGGQDVASAADLSRAVAASAPGSEVQVSLWSRGATKTVTVRPAEAEAQPSQQARGGGPAETDRLGLRLRELQPGERRLAGGEGNVVVESAEGMAAGAGIQAGDIILAVNNERVSSVQQFRSVIGRSGKSAALLVQRGAAKLFIPLRLAG